ncbi:IS3 family transposase [Rhodococcus jostii]|uniref:IS3 family transposase n=1 Tax=Rhodococcus jostii TaxID=132919 RepID=UPI003626CF98
MDEREQLAGRGDLRRCSCVLPPVEPGRYTALRFTQRLVDAGIAPSTGSVGDSFDNALAENLWSTLKNELIYWSAAAFATRAELEWALFGYIVGWYIARRVQAGLGGLSPAEYERSHQDMPHEQEADIIQPELAGAR